jgi:hypothetical protein
MAHNERAGASAHVGAGAAPKTGTCDWCYSVCPAGELTVMSGARLCQGCAAFYLGDEDEDDEDGEEK